MKISIAMATYNGARYLREQLDSFAAQTRKPDELVVCDDGSTDETLRILSDFADEAPFAVHIYKNEKNLGYAQNFSRALSLCKSELIFLSDQDDFWLSEKIHEIEQLAMAHPECRLFMNDAELANGDGTPLGLTKLGQTISLGLKDVSFTTGCCMAVKKEFLQLALPVPAGFPAHDTWINRLALLLDAKIIIPRVMQHYRRHGDNASNWLTSRITKQSRMDLVRAYWHKDQKPQLSRRLKELLLIEGRLGDYIKSDDKGGLPPDLIHSALMRIKREHAAVDERLRFLGQSRFRRWIYVLHFLTAGDYSYFSGWKSAVKDIVSR